MLHARSEVPGVYKHNGLIFFCVAFMKYMNAKPALTLRHISALFITLFAFYPGCPLVT
jgi:hypothetical protein